MSHQILQPYKQIYYSLRLALGQTTYDSGVHEARDSHYHELAMYVDCRRIRFFGATSAFPERIFYLTKGGFVHPVVLFTTLTPSLCPLTLAIKSVS